MVAYHQAAWHAFFTGAIGASAALTGLLFVAISINLDQILKFPQLPGRAAGTLGTLLASLAVSGFALAPGQGIGVLGWEIISVGAVVGLQALFVTLRKRGPSQKLTWIIAHLVSLFSPALVFIVGGVSLVIKSGGGLYWILAATLVVFVMSSINAWVLLVEIKR
jgi:modulator of FtsH protease